MPTVTRTLTCLLLALALAPLGGCANAPTTRSEPVPVSARLDADGLHLTMSDGRHCLAPRPDADGPDQGWIATLDCAGLTGLEVYQHRDAPDILPLIHPDGTGPLEIDGLAGTRWASAWIRDRQRRLWILSSDH